MPEARGFLRRNQTLLLILLAALCFAACAHQPPAEVHNKPPGFLMGLFQGFTMLFSFIGSIFLDIRIYAFPNLGFYYDLGYVMGAGCFFGGLARSR